MSTKTLLTVDQFAQLPDEEVWRYELYHGELIEVPASNPKHNLMRDNIRGIFQSFLDEHKLGVAITETEFQVGPDTVHRIDVAFLASEQWTQLDQEKSIVPFAPRLAIEIASPSDTVETLFGKAQEYLAAGAHTVLIVLWKPFQEVHVFEASGARRLLRPEETLELPELLPGFSVVVSRFFEE